MKCTRTTRDPGAGFLGDHREYQLAFELCAHYRQRFDDGYRTFHHLALPAKMGDFARTIDLLGDALDADSWISTWAMEQFDLFRDFRDAPAFQAFVAKLQDAEQAYRASELAKPLTRPPQHGVPPHPLLVGRHGNGLNAVHAAEKWAAATTFVWLTTHPQAGNIIGFRQHWWSRAITRTARRRQRQRPAACSIMRPPARPLCRPGRRS